MKTNYAIITSKKIKNIYICGKCDLCLNTLYVQYAQKNFAIVSKCTIIVLIKYNCYSKITFGLRQLFLMVSLLRKLKKN